MATSTLSRQTSDCNAIVSSSKVIATSGQFWSVGKVSTYLGVSASQVRILTEQGQLTGYTMPSGHRRLSVASVKAYANGGEVSENEQGKKVVGYARCSSAGQKDSLTRQVDRLTAHIATTYKIPSESVDVRQEICSSFSGNRKGFFELCDDISDGKISVCVSEFKNRFSRVPCQLRLLEHIAERHGCELVFLDCEETDDNTSKSDMLELVDYIQHLSATSAGRKSSLVTTVHLKAETIERIATLSNAGHTQRKIAEIIASEGHTDTKGKVISRSVIRKHILLNGNLKEIVGISKGEQASLNTLLTKWVSENVIPCEGGKLTVKDIAPRFNAWMVANGKTEVKPTVVGKWLTQVAKLPNHLSAGYRVFENVSLSAN